MSLLNTVIASQLYRLADQIIGRGGVDGCDADSASDLRIWAEDSLEIRIPGEGSSPVPRRTDGRCHYLGGEVGAHPGDRIGARWLPVYEVGTLITSRRPWPSACDRIDRQTLRYVASIGKLVPPPSERMVPASRIAVGVTTARGRSRPCTRA
jgi:hypothetical protein